MDIQMNGYYDGSRVFISLAKVFGLSVDLINFLITQGLALILASVFRSYLHPSKVSASVRHAFGLVLGLFFGYFCFGQQAIHIAGLPAVCYIVIRTQNPQIVQRIVMVVALTYLSLIHLHRQYYDYGNCSLDITGPLMIITQKVTSLAFSIHDGFTREYEDLTKSQQCHAVRKIPSPLEFFSYVLHFQGLMAGPLVFYKDYIEFIEGYHFIRNATTTNGNSDTTKQIVHEPSPVKAVVKKVMASMLCAYIFMKFVTVYPIKRVEDDDFLNNTSFIYKLWFMMMSTTIVRFKYYFAWLLADAICNNSGLGFNGYDKDGIAKWDLISNIYIIPFEIGTNFRDCINNWNMGTNLWLRMVVYERVPKKYGTLLTFSLSALWHGFYPGYYLTFASGAFNVMAARTARRLFRHRFQKTLFMSRFYDILTCLITRLFMGYATFPFVLLQYQASLRLYLKVYTCLHLVALVTIFVLPKLIKGEPNSSSHKLTKKLTSAIENQATQIDSDLVSSSNDVSPPNNFIKNAIHNNFLEKNISIKTKLTNDKTNKTDSDNDDNLIDKNANNHEQNLKEYKINSRKNSSDAKCNPSDSNLSHIIKEKIEIETRNIEELIDKTVNGIVELKVDLMRMNENQDLFIIGDGLRKRAHTDISGVDTFLKKEIEAINAAVF